MELSCKQKLLPLNFGYHDVMCMTPLERSCSPLLMMSWVWQWRLFTKMATD